jgi:L-type amino acid transporter 9
MFWLAGGVVAACGGLVFCELGTMIPVSGAEVAYLKKIYGPLPGFLSVWMVHFLLGGMRRAVGVLGFSKYFWSLFYENPVTEVNWWVNKLVALSVLYIIVAVVTFKPTLILKSIVFFTTSKFLATTIIIIAGFIYLGKGHTENISVGFKGTNGDAKEWGVAWNGVIWSYLGWEQICIVTSEIQNPQRNIPIIVFCSMAIITALYLLTVISYHIVLPLSVLMQDKAVASEFGYQTMGDPGKVILALTVVLSTLGNIQGTFLTTSRYIHSGSAERLLPSCLSLVSKRFRTPIVSIIYLAGVTSVFIIIGGINDLISSATFTMFPFHVACAIGVFVMRKTHPKLPRPYKVPLIFPALFIVFGLYIFITPFLGEKWLISLIWVLVLLLGLPLYFLILKNVFRFEFLRRWDANITALLARLLGCH